MCACVCARVRVCVGSQYMLLNNSVLRFRYGTLRFLSHKRTMSCKHPGISVAEAVSIKGLGQALPQAGSLGAHCGEKGCFSISCSGQHPQ